ncbi:PH domain-containing protein [Nocardiopsis halotolerans]|uniref:PH domain-containing protein n=1 Tax=Nocardiopsis halotolerans TaxID=124252 RepID=UPI00034C5F54|nr:PH domain-containing protein [Nocardiopsis halotolerans]
MTNTPPHDADTAPEGPPEPGGGGTARLRPPLRRVSGRAIGVWTLRILFGGVLTLLLFSALAWAASSLGWAWIPAWARDNAWLLPVVYAVYVLLKVAVVPSWRYRVHRWEVSGDVIYTRAGWISRSWQLVPVNRIQTVDHTQGWLERVFDVATLEVQTASYAGSSTIEGLDTDEARRLSEELAVRAGTLRDDAT